MSEHEKPAPDFAMLRAVEILAEIALKNSPPPLVPPAPIDRPVVLFNERRTFQLGTTTRYQVVRDLGTGAAYPAAGWWTYAVRFAGSRRLVSVIFHNDVLSGVETYLPKGKSVPRLPLHSWGDFRLIPGEIRIGAALTALDPRYTPAVGGPSPLMYAQAFEIRFPGGLGYVMGNAGVAERLALYAAA
jgi:hypothetical protein